MGVADHGRLLDRLEPVTLAELDERAGLQTRRDRKYVVPLHTLHALLAVWRDGGLRALEISGQRTFSYESLYFDTGSLRTYHLAARDRPRRYKVRTRTYVDSRHTLLEVKQRDGRGHTVKHRQPHDFERRAELTHDAREHLIAFEPLITEQDRFELAPVLATSYRRATLYAPDVAVRTTIDTDLHCATADGVTVHLDDVAIVETKSPGASTAVDRDLWRSGHRPVRISKYATGLAAIRSDLPANRWSRVLVEHFDRRRSSAR